MVSIQVAETCRSTKTTLCAVAGNKTSVQKATAWNMYNINYIKKVKHSSHTMHVTGTICTTKIWCHT